MAIIGRAWLKIKNEIRFILEQKWGIIKPTNPYSISKSILKKYLSISPVIIDCGAHVGSDSIELAKIFPKGKIYSIEPIPDIYAKLIRNTNKFSNIKCYQIALSDDNGYTKMYVSSGGSDGSSSLLKPTGHLVDHPDTNFNETIEVKTQTLDAWAFENKLKKIDFLWLDMQGVELNMLQASKTILQSVKIIHIEVSLRETYAGVALYMDLRKWLEIEGFEVVQEAIPEGTDMGNVLFVRTNANGERSNQSQIR